MNILLINGSPKGKASNSLRLAKSFIEGISEQHVNEDVTVEQLNVATMDIKPSKAALGRSGYLELPALLLQRAWTAEEPY